MTPVEIMALIIALFAAIKILVVLIKPKAWISVVKTVYKIPALTLVIALILAAVVLNYLLIELTIVQIFAVMLFLCLLGALTISIYVKDVESVAFKMLKDRKFLRKAWLAILIWVILIIWVLYALFA